MRIFVAVNLPASLRDALAEAVRPLTRTRGLRAVAPDALHVTLHFIGHVQDARVPAAAEAVAAAADGLAAFSLQTSGLGAFPNVRRPRVWWVGVSTPPGLLTLQERVAARLGQDGFRGEERAFHPHLTVGRVKDSASRDDVAAMRDAASGFAFDESFPVTSVELMRSDLRREGARYSVVQSFPLVSGG